MDLLRVSKLTVEASGSGKSAVLLEDISFNIQAGQVLGLVGETGSGKSTLALSLLGLLPDGLAQTSGEVVFDHRNLTTMSERDLAGIRGSGMALVFQDSLRSLNPSRSIGSQLTELVRHHHNATRSQARAAVPGLLLEVGLAPALADTFAHRLNAGSRQRALLALSLACHPRLIMVDEPTAGLDCVSQTGAAALIKRLAGRNLSLMLISHNIRFVSAVSHQLLVIYAGRICEYGPTSALLKEPSHPYTAGLLASQCPTDPEVSPPERLPTLAGTPADMSSLPSGCAFHPRCPQALPVCQSTVPSLVQRTGRSVACHAVSENADAREESMGIGLTG